MISIAPAVKDPTIVAALKVNPKTKAFPTKQLPKTRRARVWAIDFDGTICKNRYPDIGEPNMELIEALKFAKASGVRLILWTCRTNRRLSEAVDWCTFYDLEFDAVNENLPEAIEMYGEDTRKVCADLYIDDKAFPWWGKGTKGELWKLLDRV